LQLSGVVFIELIRYFPRHFDDSNTSKRVRMTTYGDWIIDMLYDTTWAISHNAARGGIRLIGPKPKWARSDGGEGGAHPSNVIEYGYPVGTPNWTGDNPCLLPLDCPDFGAFCVQHYDREGRLLAARPDEGWKQAQILSCVPGRCYCKAT
jgi:hypothetical protein